MASYKIRTAGNCPAVLFTIWSPFNIRIGRGNSLPIRLLQAEPFSFAATKIRIGHGNRCRHDCRRRNHSSLPLRKLESDAGHRSRDGRCRRAIPHCCDDGAAVIRKSGPEIKNHCTLEDVSGQNHAAIPKFTPSNQESLHAKGRKLGKTCSDSQINPLKSRIDAREWP